MSETVGTIFTDANIAMPDMDLASPYTTGLRHLNTVHKELCEEFRLYETSADLTLSTSAREYALAEGSVSVWSAEYRTTSTSAPFPLIPSSIPEFDAEWANWRNDQIKGQPTMFYVDAKSDGTAVIGFDRIPATASSGGYPTVRCWISTYTAFTQTTDVISALCKTHWVYVYGLCSKFAKIRKNDEAEYWTALYENEKDLMGVYIQRRQRNNDPKTIPMLRTGIGAI